MPARRAVCIHGHYYQPPREHPWLGVLEPEPTAAPDHDWNERILRECYAPNGAARLLDARGRLRGVVDNYAWTSFNVGPTLDAWMAAHAPHVIDALVRGDRDSRERTGHGNAWAQAYNHPILPLCTPRDVRTQVRWGVRAFELRYGRRPDGMWLPEMAVDVTTLEALAAAGVTLTMLSPHQARRVRPLGARDDAWTQVDETSLDVRRLHRARLPSGATLDVVFRDADSSKGLAFGELLRDGGVLARRVASLLDDRDGLLTAATDGETFGHHHRFGEMAVAYAIERWRISGDVEVTNPAAFRATVPTSDEVEIVEGSSWSCAHGLERWRDDCGCKTGGPPEWTQAWRRPLRAAIDWLRDELAVVFETEGGAILRDPWEARDRWIDAVIAPDRAEAVVAPELRPGAEPVRARRVLEMARHALLMQTSCGWFFDDVAGVEATLILRQAGRAMDLASALGRTLESGFLERLEQARSNVATEGTAADVYRRTVIGRPVTPPRIAATAVLLDRLGAEPALPGYGLAVGPGEEELVVGIVEERTGARSQVKVRAAPRGAVPSCEADGRRYAVGDLFLVQRARLMRKVAHDAVEVVRAARRDALGQLRAIIDPLMARDAQLPVELAFLVGYDAAERLAVAVRDPLAPLATLASEVGTLQARGAMLPVLAVTRAVADELSRAIERLPDGTERALALLDFAASAGVVLDLADSQITVVRWWQRTRPVPDARLTRLREALDLSPELEAS